MLTVVSSWRKQGPLRRIALVVAQEDIEDAVPGDPDRCVLARAWARLGVRVSGMPGVRIGNLRLRACPDAMALMDRFDGGEPIEPQTVHFVMEVT